MSMQDRADARCAAFASCDISIARARNSAANRTESVIGSLVELTRAGSREIRGDASDHEFHLLVRQLRKKRETENARGLLLRHREVALLVPELPSHRLQVDR